MTRLLRLTLACSFCLLGFACSKPSDKSAATTERTKPTTPPAPLDRQGALLQAGYAAVLVAFPEPTAKGDWLAMVTLEGADNTDALPRIPLEATHSVTVLNVPPGQYTVTAHALVRKSPIYAGGISNPVTLKPGEIYVLRAENVSNSAGSYQGVALHDVGSQPWGLTKPGEIVKYIAKISEQARG